MVLLSSFSVTKQDSKVGNGFLITQTHVLTTFRQVKNTDLARTTKFQFNHCEGKRKFLTPFAEVLEHRNYYGKSVVLNDEELDFSIVEIDIPQDNELPFIKPVVEVTKRIFLVS